MYISHFQTAAAAIVCFLVGFATAKFTLTAPLPTTSGAVLQLSPEVQKYIDSKLGGGSVAAGCEGLPKLVTRMAEVESSVAEADRLKTFRQQLESNRGQLEEERANRFHDTRQILDNLRQQEMQRLRMEIARTCVGQSSETPAAGGDTSGSAGVASSRPRGLFGQPRGGLRGGSNGR